MTADRRGGRANRDHPNVFSVSLRRFDVKPGGRTREATLRRTFG